MSGVGDKHLCDALAIDEGQCGLYLALDLWINLYLSMMRWKEHYNLMVPVAKDSIHQFNQLYSLIKI